MLRRLRSRSVLPPSLPERFTCVHRIFGASNVARMLQQLLAHQRAQAADTLSLEAYWRVRDPVYGSVGIINLLQQEIYGNQHELARTQAQIAMYRAQHDHHHQQQQQQQQEQRETADGDHEPVEPTPFLGPPQQDNCALERTFLESNHFPDFF
uniref:LOB domain-containing protein n=1 Tax=Ananas comosus var. bracteatus TaxID=296719 RepID=A0A6V7QBW8_ANACO|nr:unnamed protein product [Ananas comosus var. bracteatus]